MKSYIQEFTPEPGVEGAAHIVSRTSIEAFEFPVDDRSIIFDQTDVVILWGDKIAAYLGIAAKEALGRPIMETFPGHGFPLPSELQITEHMTRFGGYRRVHVVRHRSGKGFLFRISAITHRMPSGRSLRRLRLEPVVLNLTCRV